ncbi:MAG TPA: hypothetical protein VF469_12045 [Kofleriaceae bacterium]
MKAKAQPAKRPAGKRVKSTARRATGARAGKASAAKSAGKHRAPRRTAGRPAPARRGRARPSRRTRRAPASRWIAFVEQHGVVLASARGPVPCVAEAVAGQPIVGSWWAHPRGRAIFAALSELDDSDDVRCFKLVDGKVTFVHRRVWPALACLAGNGVIDAGRVTAIQQEHMPTGEHRNLVTPYPDWVPDDVARAAAALTIEAARAQLGTWV